jgi:hypothetical protein
MVMHDGEGEDDEVDDDGAVVVGSDAVVVDAERLELLLQVTSPADPASAKASAIAVRARPRTPNPTLGSVPMRPFVIGVRHDLGCDMMLREPHRLLTRRASGWRTIW